MRNFFSTYRHASLALVIFGILAASFFSFAPVGNAQLPTREERGVILYLTPRQPGPNEEVTIRAENYAIDIDRAEVLWYINGALQKRGVGANEFSFTTGSIGSETTVRVVIRTASGNTSETTRTIPIGVIDMLWHANTYTPPFYKGKALATAQSSVTITAQPFLLNAQGERIPPGQLIYDWQRDGIALKSASGFGRQSIEVEAPRTYQSKIITVEVSSASGQITARGGISIRAATPFIAFYEKHPLEGIRYERALTGTFDLAREELVVRAEPYFFPRQTVTQSSPSNFEWQINNRPFSPQNALEVVLRRQEDARGRSRVGLTIQDFVNLQQAANSFFVDFSSPGE